MRPDHRNHTNTAFPHSRPPWQIPGIGRPRQIERKSKGTDLQGLVQLADACGAAAGPLT
jgi:hypothetical protein